MYAKVGNGGPWMYGRPWRYAKAVTSGPWMYAKVINRGPWMYAVMNGRHGRCARPRQPTRRSPV